MTSQTFIGGIGARSGSEFDKTLGEIIQDLPTRFVVGRLSGELVADLQRLLEQADDLAGKDLGAARRGFFQVMSAAQHVGLALLMTGILELVVAGPAVVDQGARPIDAKDTLQSIRATLRVDVIAGDTVITDPGMEPD